jgi:electron transfer flavoprotein alpha subunit
MTPPPRVRRDPRDAAAARQRAGGRPAEVAPETAAPLRIDTPDGLVLAVPDLASGRLSAADRELMGAARQLADLLGGALALLAGRAPEVALRFRPELEGADRVLLPLDPAFAQDLAEPRVAFVLAALEAYAPRHVLFPETPLGGELARRVAARLGERPGVGVWRFSAAEATLAIDSGRGELRRPLPRILLPAPGAFAPITGGPVREGRPLPLAGDPLPPLARLERTLPVDPATVPLAEADLILSAGAGVTDWAGFHRAAAALGAAEAGSRVVCDAGHLSRDRQVGVSGTLVAPRCYLAFGISGASQHLAGIAAAERVVAVNADPGAEMMHRADLAIVADAQPVLAELARRATERRGGRDGG